MSELWSEPDITPNQDPKSFWCKIGFHDWEVVRQDYERVPGLGYVSYTDRVCLKCKITDFELTNRRRDVRRRAEEAEKIVKEKGY